MGISAIKLFNVLCKKLGEEESNSLAEFMHEEIDAGIRQQPEVFLTKDDKSALSCEINGVKTDLTDRVNEVQIGLTDKINNVQTGLTGRIDEAKTDLTDRINKVQAGLTNKINDVQISLTGRINEVKTDLIDRINGVQVGLIGQMNKNKTEILVWIVGTGILQFLMVLLFKRI